MSGEGYAFFYWHRHRWPGSVCKGYAEEFSICIWAWKEGRIPR